MVEFSPREKYKEVKESTNPENEEENTLSLEELREREAIEQKILETKRENLEQQIEAEQTPDQNTPQAAYEPFAQQGMYDLKQEPEFWKEQKLQEDKEKEERQRRSLL